MIRMEDVNKTFESDHGVVHAVKDVTMEVPQGEICILLGPSGCGKTTTLKLVNRLIPRSSGNIYLNDRDTDEYSGIELRRHIGYVIQQIGLFPNMTVEENITVVPRILGWSEKSRRERARELIRMVAMEESLLGRYPKELSGGQQQRIGLARGLAGDPPVLLMDEPFGAVDPINREIIQDEFLKMQAELKKTILFVSHDIDEAIKMGDKIAIFRDGRLVQFGTPDDLLARPANDFVANFVGGDRELKRMRLIKVQEVLDTGVPTVREDANIKTAAQMIRKSGYDWIVVIDEKNHPRGYITCEQADTGGAKTCEDILHPLVKLVTPGDDLRTAVSQMFTHETGWLAAVDEDGKFLGVVSEQRVKEVLHTTRRGKRQGAA